MRAGVLSETGFLGKNEKLVDDLERDAKTVAKMGLSYEDLASGLEQLILSALNSENRMVNTGKYLVKLKVFTGFQICPWTKDIHHSQCQEGGGVKYASIDWWIRNNITGQELSGSGLIVHLIRAHRFFEGIESPYRVDPEKLAILLGLRASKEK